ncbi:oocyte zinc finger protein XlCOF8.4-like [Wyeomyia smithii]|uniref:oocyte zinc finger protein XlCOF8.4-like n=1 Tax=Wyeomyia smithii TaxID=174621 RepID=UPI0024680159|nr:oocyte zinc finger protein XlCOF8.4-like [Wyeomyia smithii]
MATDAQPKIPCNDPTKFCRLCFSQQDMYWVIHTNGTEVDRPFINTINECLGLWLQLDADFPCAVCRQCTIELERITEFREKCHLCHQALKAKRQLDSSTIKLKNKNWISKPPVDEDIEEQIIAATCVKAEKQKPEVPYKCRLTQVEKKMALKSYFDSYKKWARLPKDDDEKTISASEAEEFTDDDVDSAAEELSSNQEFSDPRNPLFCCLCESFLDSSDNLKGHLALHHRNDKGFSCNKCGKHFVAYGLLKQHWLRHETELMIHCAKCGLQFWRQTEVQAHQKSGDCRNKKPMFCKCEYCDRIFSNRGRYLFHLKALHPNRQVTKSTTERTSMLSQDKSAPAVKLVSDTHAIKHERCEVKLQPITKRKKRNRKKARPQGSKKRKNKLQSTRVKQTTKTSEPANVVCIACFIQFETIAVFKLHVNRCFGRDKTHPVPCVICHCTICEPIFHKTEQYTVHVQQHGQPADTKPHDCPVCIEWTTKVNHNSVQQRSNSPLTILGE